MSQCAGMAAKKLADHSDRFPTPTPSAGARSLPPGQSTTPDAHAYPLALWRATVTELRARPTRPRTAHHGRVQPQPHVGRGSRRGGRPAEVGLWTPDRERRKELGRHRPGLTPKPAHTALVVQLALFPNSASALRGGSRAPGRRGPRCGDPERWQTCLESGCMHWPAPSAVDPPSYRPPPRQRVGPSRSIPGVEASVSAPPAEARRFSIGHLGMGRGTACRSRSGRSASINARLSPARPLRASKIFFARRLGYVMRRSSCPEGLAIAARLRVVAAQARLAGRVVPPA